MTVGAAACLGAVLLAVTVEQGLSPVATDAGSRAAVAQGLSPVSAKPELPRARVDIAEPRLHGRTLHVAAGQSLQEAIDQAAPGDRITLQPGATYAGPFRLPKKDGDGWILIASSAAAKLPAGKRVTPADARHMAKLVTASRSAIIAEPGAHHYRFAGLEIAPAPGAFIYNLIQLGEDESDAADVPHHIVFDRSYIHGDP